MIRPHAQPPPTPTEPRWEDNAACRTADPEIFFPDKGGSTREAKAICATCPVATQCADYALEHDERFGIWGGLSKRERRRLRDRGITGDQLHAAVNQARQRTLERIANAIPKAPRREATCGTRSGLQAHQRRGDEPCTACVEAERDYQRQRHRQRTARTPRHLTVFEEARGA